MKQSCGSKALFPCYFKGLRIKNSPLPLKNITHIPYFLQEYRASIGLPSTVHLKV